MNRLNTLGVILLLALSSGPAVARVPGADLPGVAVAPHLAAQLVVKLAPGTDAGTAAQILAGSGATVVEQIDALRLALLAVDATADLTAAIALLQADPRIEFAEPNFLYAALARPNDLDFSQQWAKDNTGVNAPMGLGTPGADMNLIAAWDTRATAPNVVVAIIDDSLQTNHIDLVGNVLATGRCFASANSPRPCTNGPNDPNPADADDSHGTLVAGAAGARGNNGLGIAGSAWQVSLLPLKVDLSLFAIVQAVDEALAQGAQIINMSFGGPGNSAAFSEAVDRAQAAGALIVAAAGNADASNDRASHFPSDYPQPNVLSVAATNATDHVARFSQWGALGVDLAAPGELILTTAVGNGYAVASGTSFAAPHVAGVAALIQAHTGSSGYAPLVASLLHGGVEGVSALGPVVPGQDKRALPGRVASGRLDAARALDGPAGGVVLLDALTVDDTVGGNDNGRLDPGETALLEVTLRNVWLPVAGVSGVLSTPDSGLLSINDTAPVAFGALPQGGTATARFSVTLAAGAHGHAAIFVQLDLAAAGAFALPSRYAYLDVGTLNNGVTVSQSIQRWDWDEFHAWHIDVPAGSRQLTVATSGSGDVDLLLRHREPPAYLITLAAEARGLGGFYYVDGATTVSGGAGADESISIANPLPGTWHVVVVNYDQVAKDYALTASFAVPGADVIAFGAASYTIAEGADSLLVDVTRSGALHSASVEFHSAAGSATAGVDYVETSGTLTWAAGETGVKTIALAMLDDGEDEAGETVTLTLANASGATLGSPATVTVTITDDDVAAVPLPQPPAPAPAGDSGGGGAIALFIVLGGLYLVASRTRREHRDYHTRHLARDRRRRLAFTDR